MTGTGGLLGVFAHPDDEAYSMAGLMARYTDEGIPVANLCFTRGEVGLIAEGSGATPETLGEVREAELRAACAAVGVTDVRIVGTPDGGTEANEEGVETIAAVMRELQPRVIVTMEPQGVTRHPDHIAVSQMASDAFHRVREENGGAFPQRLYYSAIPKSALAAFTDELQRRGLPGLTQPDDPLAPKPAPDESIAAVVDVIGVVHAQARRAARPSDPDVRDGGVDAGRSAPGLPGDRGVPASVPRVHARRGARGGSFRGVPCGGRWHRVNDPDCLFCKIVAGEIPSTVVMDRGDVFAFRDVSPQAPTHILIVPKDHLRDVAAMDASHGGLLAEMVEAANELARAEGIDGSGLPAGAQRRARRRPNRLPPAPSRPRRPSDGVAAGLRAEETRHSDPSVGRKALAAGEMSSLDRLGSSRRGEGR